jgi:hypothetical protein
MRTRGRLDANQAEIIDAVRRVGADVCSLARVGDGMADLLICFRRQLTLLEVKRPRGGRLTPAQRTRHARWPIHVVTTVDQALRAIGALAARQVAPPPRQG